jgi:Acyl-protein synthetase, LuxE
VFLPDVQTERAALHREARVLISENRERCVWFSGFAAKLLQFQARTNPMFARLVSAHGVALDALTLENAPAVPVDVFKHGVCFSGAPADVSHTFLTSGTTLGAQGRHAFASLETYRAGALAWGRRALFAKPAQVLALSPRYADAPDSSLTFMMDAFASDLSTAPAAWLVREGSTRAAFDVDLAALSIAIANAQAPIVVLATSFALVHMLDALETLKDSRGLHLPAGSIVMQTGGFKGRSREVDADTLRRQLAETFGLPLRSIVSEYGMTELSSQFYEFTAVDEAAPSGVFREPPWAQIVPVDPQTLKPVREGDVGLARIVDLLNIDSVCVLLTQDCVRRVPLGFELLGREPSAPRRGCSIGMDELLSGLRS